METEPKPETLVVSLLEQLRDGGVGTVQVWGAHVVRPSDQVFEVKTASFSAGVLRVVLFLALDGEERLVEVEGPRGAKVSKAGLRVAEASRVRVFGQEFTQPAGASAPALFLGQ
jgi:hypothetical protein